MLRYYEKYYSMIGNLRLVLGEYSLNNIKCNYTNPTLINLDRLRYKILFNN